MQNTTEACRQKIQRTKETAKIYTACLVSRRSVNQDSAWFLEDFVQNSVVPISPSFISHFKQKRAHIPSTSRDETQIRLAWF